MGASGGFSLSVRFTTCLILLAVSGLRPCPEPARAPNAGGGTKAPDAANRPVLRAADTRDHTKTNENKRCQTVSNERGIQTPRGVGQWQAGSVSQLLKRMPA
jgi:hypothetical protein